MMTGMANPWRLPTSKSLASCAGVIFTAPVPNAASVYVSAIIGMRTPMIGSTTSWPIIARYRSSSGLTATATSPSIVSGRVVATVIDCVGSSASTYLRWYSLPVVSVNSASSSDSEVPQRGHQWMTRWPLYTKPSSCSRTNASRTDFESAGENV